MSFCSTGALAAALGRNPLPASSVPYVDPPRGVCGPLLLTQTTSQIPVTPSTVSCNGVSNHSENSYYREYGSAALPRGLDVCAVELAIELSDAGDPATSQPLTINLYRQTGGAFPGGTRTQIGTATVQVPDGLRGFNVPVTGQVPPGQSLVVEAFLADGRSTGNLLFLGSNGAGESAPTFLRAPDCGVSTPVTVASLSFPNVHLILNPRGSALASAATPVPGGGPLALLFGALGLVSAGVYFLRRRMT